MCADHLPFTKRALRYLSFQGMERVNGNAPSSQPWQGRALLLSYTRIWSGMSVLPRRILFGRQALCY